MRKKLHSKLWGWAGFFTHIHHAQANPIEWSYNIRGRFENINNHKYLRERALRKALIRRVPDSLLPKPALNWINSLRNLEEADQKYEEALKDWQLSPHQAEIKKLATAEKRMQSLGDRSNRLWNEVERISVRKWIKVHEQVCHPNCRWTPDSPNIFNDGYSTSVLRRKKRK